MNKFQIANRLQNNTSIPNEAYKMLLAEATPIYPRLAATESEENQEQMESDLNDIIRGAY